MPKTRAKTPRRKPAGGQRASAGGRPFLSGFVYGAVAGVVVTLAIVYYPGELPSIDMPLVDSDTEDATVPTVEFEFMYRLPRERVVTNVEPLHRPADHVAPVVAEAESGMEYLLQAAAFRGRNDADAMRARLILATNMTAEIESARDPAGGTLHRVLVGPFESREEMQRTLATLHEMDISPVALERPKG